MADEEDEDREEGGERKQKNGWELVTRMTEAGIVTADIDQLQQRWIWEASSEDYAGEER